MRIDFAAEDRGKLSGDFYDCAEFTLNDFFRLSTSINGCLRKAKAHAHY
jgi:hypothetical protein